MIVGVDGTPGSNHALDWALNRVDRFGPLRPLAAWQYPYWAVAGPLASEPPIAEPARFETAARAHAQSAVASLPESARQKLRVCEGPAGAVLVEAGDDADMIVVGTRGRDIVSERILGSVSSYVAAHTTVPAAVVPTTATTSDELGRIVVGIDGSANSIEALAWAIKTAPKTAIIDAIYVWSNLVRMSPEPYVIPIEDSESEAQATLDRAVALAIERAGSEPSIEAHLSYGDDARNVLRAEAQASDLLVLGTRGRGGVLGLLLGSVTTSLIHRADIATIVVPSPDGRVP